ncbi:glycosyltransferase [Cytobacillus kochii]|uniref:glycosyltransferase n=1 Tax=Cytobacillus kochii TaxID=859143 RepID=UPI0025A0D24D|nr:glycosyltransferase [Cytobacillus kochii]MDM5209489.1 glycosyltransferase [Cytobacillus kochii]
MKKVYVATKARGFLEELFNNSNTDVQFVYKQKKIYEINSKRKLFLSKIVKSKIADYLGIIQRIKVNKNSSDNIFSYNRFLKSTEDYIIYLENPLALVHYSTNRNKKLMGKIRLKRYFNDPKLKSIVCLSKACYETLHNFYKIPNNIEIKQIYPYVRQNNLTNKVNIKEKCEKEQINCLYISSNFGLKGGKEILSVFKTLKNIGVNNIKLQIITQTDKINKTLKNEIDKNENIKLDDFNYTKEDLYKIYNESSIYLNPTRQDSFSLVVLEAMKSGNAILTTDLYALPEMVESGFNGYLTEPKFRFFRTDNMPNEEVWNNRGETIYSEYIDRNIVGFLLEKLIYLNTNREVLLEMALNSYEKSNCGEFNDQFIMNEWSKLFSRI